MYSKVDRIVCSWLSLMLDRASTENAITLPTVLFTLDELAERANSIFSSASIVSSKDVKNAVAGLGAAAQSKVLIQGPFESLRHYYRLNLNTSTNYSVPNMIRSLLVDSSWHNDSRYLNFRDIQSVMEEYARLCSNITEISQTDSEDITSREAVWLAAATLSYNEFYRSKSCDVANYSFKQKEIAKLAKSFNKKNPIESCNTMAQAACVKGKNQQLYSYLVEMPNSLRRLSFYGEDDFTQPPLHTNFPVLTINGFQPASVLEAFVKRIFSQIINSPYSVPKNIHSESDIDILPIDWSTISSYSNAVPDQDTGLHGNTTYDISDFSEKSFRDPIKLLQEMEILDDCRISNQDGENAKLPTSSSNSPLTECVFFWQEDEEHGYLSLCHPAVFSVEGVTYQTCEQYVMAKKALAYHDHEHYILIMNEPDPKKDIEYGNAIHHNAEIDWDECYEEVLYNANLAKFAQNSKLKTALLSTATKILVDADPFDTVNGIGLESSNPDAKSPEKWNGRNLLGVVLSRVRNVLA